MPHADETAHSGMATDASEVKSAPGADSCANPLSALKKLPIDPVPSSLLEPIYLHELPASRMFVQAMCAWT